MEQPREAMLLRIFIGEADKYKGKPVYEQIVLKARELHLAGATVLRGIMGFGAKSHLHSAKILRLSEDLPVVIELADTQENLDKLMPFLEETVRDGIITLEKIRLIRRSSAAQNAGDTETRQS